MLNYSHLVSVGKNMTVEVFVSSILNSDGVPGVVALESVSKFYLEQKDVSDYSKELKTFTW